MPRKPKNTQTHEKAPVSQAGAQELHKLVAHLFRHKSGQLVSTLTRIFGLEHLGLAEDVVQETLLKALQLWPYRGIPANPGAWLLRTARNHALDILRREAAFRDKQQEILQRMQEDSAPHEQNGTAYLPAEIHDDQLRMMFACCHPILPRHSQIALTLKTLCGFSVNEIARAFLCGEKTIAQRLVRAKRAIRQSGVRFDVPAGAELPARLDAVLETLYLLFSEGHNAHFGEDLIRQELCAEAIRLTKLLAEHPAGNQPKVHALLALMCLQASRLPARTDPEGELLLLAEQDRSLWHRELMHQGLRHLAASAAGDELTEFHLQAGIAACHAMASSYEETDWQRILSLYDQLMALNRSPIIALNRAVALSMVHGPKAAIAALRKIADLPSLQSYALLPATFGDLHYQLGEHEVAASYYRRAIKLAGTSPERRFLRKRLLRCTR